MHFGGFNPDVRGSCLDGNMAKRIVLTTDDELLSGDSPSKRIRTDLLSESAKLIDFSTEAMVPPTPRRIVGSQDVRLDQSLHPTVSLIDSRLRTSLPTPMSPTTAFAPPTAQMQRICVGGKTTNRHSLPQNGGANRPSTGSRKSSGDSLMSLLEIVPDYSVLDDDIPQTFPADLPCPVLFRQSSQSPSVVNQLPIVDLTPTPQYSPAATTVVPPGVNKPPRFCDTNGMKPTATKYPRQKFVESNIPAPTSSSKKSANTDNNWRQTPGKNGLNGGSLSKPSSSASMSCCDVTDDIQVTPDVERFLATYGEAFVVDHFFNGSRIGFIDTHAHIDHVFNMFKFKGSWNDFKKKYDSSFPRCFEAVIADFCFPSQFLGQNIASQLAQEPNANLFFAYGCHPHSADQWEMPEFKDKILKLLEGKSTSESGRVVAMGEMGLDYSPKNKVDHDVQRRVFIDQMETAVKLKLPVLLHIRDADEDGLEMLKQNLPTHWKIHWHCFNRTNLTLADAAMKHFPHLKFGLTPFVSTTEAMNQVLRQIPLRRFLIETDAPYFSPDAMRKGIYKCPRGHPGMGVLVAVKLANVNNKSVAEVLDVIRKNTNEMYGI